jgi:hypothetical protein
MRMSNAGGQGINTEKDGSYMKNAWLIWGVECLGVNGE